MKILKILYPTKDGERITVLTDLNNKKYSLPKGFVEAIEKERACSAPVGGSPAAGEGQVAHSPDGVHVISVGHFELVKIHDFKEAVGEILDILKIGVSDWLHVYADDLCDPKEVEKARERFNKYGALGYICSLNELIDKFRDGWKI